MSLRVISDTQGCPVYINDRILVQDEKTGQLMYCLHTKKGDNFHIKLDSAEPAENVKIVPFTPIETPAAADAEPSESAQADLPKTVACSSTSTVPSNAAASNEPAKKSKSKNPQSAQPKCKMTILNVPLVKSTPNKSVTQIGTNQRVIINGRQVVLLNKGSSSTVKITEVTDAKMSEEDNSINSNLDEFLLRPSDDKYHEMSSEERESEEQHCHEEQLLQYEEEEEWKRDDIADEVEITTLAMKSDIDWGNEQNGIWTREDTLKLISLYKEMLPLFNSTSIKKNKVWQKIALKLPPYTTQQCINRWKYLRRRYIAKVDRGFTKLSQKRINFEFFDEMTSIFHKTHTVRRPLLSPIQSGENNCEGSSKRTGISDGFNQCKNISSNSVKEEMLLETSSNNVSMANSTPPALSMTTNSPTLTTTSSSLIRQQRKLRKLDRNKLLARSVSAMEKLANALDKIAEKL